MSSGSGGGGSGSGAIGRREVAVRCFAAEYDDASLEYSESDEERAPNYVVTPTGARVNRLFVVGVLTEVESVSDDVLRGRVVDPTGAFVVYAGQYQPDAKAALDRAEPPAFVAVTGKARTFEPDDGDRVYTSIRPESISVVDSDTRDRWTVQAAEHTVERVATFAAALAREERGAALTEALSASGVDPALSAGIPRAIDHYGTTPAYLAAVRELALQAAGVAAGEREEAEPLDLEPGEGGAVEADLTAGVTIEAAAPAGAGETAPEQAQSGETTETVAAEPTETAETEVAAETAEPEPDAAGDELGDFDGYGGDDETAEAADAEVTSSTDADAEAVPDEPETNEPVTDELYEIDDEEREAIEEEFGTEFSTGNEVEEPGEAGIETPGPETGSEQVEETAADATETTADEAEADETEEAKPSADADDVDLVDAAVATMRELDDGDGAERGAVVDAVASEHSVDEGAVEDAIQDALMGGRCYEPDDGRLKAI